MDVFIKILMWGLLFAGIVWAIIAIAPFLAAIIVAGLLYAYYFDRDDNEDNK